MYYILMGYLEKTLATDEVLTIKGRLTTMYVIPKLLLLVILAIMAISFDNKEYITEFYKVTYIILIIIAGQMFLKNLIKFLTTEIAITNQRVLYKEGFLNRNTIELGIDQIESISLIQPLDGRMFNYGTLIITGTGGTDEVIKWIESPGLIKEKIYEVKNNFLAKNPSTVAK